MAGERAQETAAPVPVRNGGALGTPPVACGPFINQLSLRTQATERSGPHAATGHRRPSHLLLLLLRAKAGVRVLAVLPHRARLFFPPVSGRKTGGQDLPGVAPKGRR